MSASDDPGLCHHELPASTCPCCGKDIGATGCWMTPGGRPEPGRLAICGRCRALLTLDKKLRVRELTLEELQVIPLDARRRLAQLRALLAQEGPQ